MRTPLATIVVILGICSESLTLSAAVPLRWQVETSRVQPVQIDAYHGETLHLEAALQSYGKPFAITNAASVCWQTNGMGSVYWTAPAMVSNNVLSVDFTPAMDPGTPIVNGHIGVPGENWRAAFQLRFRPSPGAVPNTIPLPVPVLDFDAIEVLDPPWPAEISAATNDLASAVSSELEEYVKTNHIGSVSITGGFVQRTNCVAYKMSHAEGMDTVAGSPPNTVSVMTRIPAHAEGYQTKALKWGAHAEGLLTTADGPYAHSEGGYTEAHGSASHSEGYHAVANGSRSHAEGQSTTASGEGAHAEGERTTAFGVSSHAEGEGTTASGGWSHAEGRETETAGQYSHAEGWHSKTVLGATYSYAAGYKAQAAHIFSFCWRGWCDVNLPDAYYNSHGPGTFNISPYGGIDGFWIGETNFAQHVRNIVASDGGAEKHIAMFILPLNFSTNETYMCVELKATVNNFMNGTQLDKTIFYCHTASLDLSTADGALAFVENFGDTSYDARSYMSVADASDPDVLETLPRSPAMVVLVDVSHCRRTNGAWLSDKNEELLWTYARGTMGGFEAEGSGRNRAMWRPCAPVKWLSHLPRWATAD